MLDLKCFSVCHYRVSRCKAMRLFKLYVRVSQTESVPRPNLADKLQDKQIS